MNWKRGKHFKTFSAAPMLGTRVDDEEDDDEDDDVVAIDDDVVASDNETDDDVEVLDVADNTAVPARTRCSLDASKLSPSSLSLSSSGSLHGRLGMLL